MDLSLSRYKGDEELMEGTQQRGVLECFPRLPIELRLKIWHNCEPGPRVIEINSDKQGMRFITATRAPVGLHICQESRAETLRTYELLQFRNGTNSGDEEVYDLDYIARIELAERELAAQGLPSGLDEAPRLRDFCTYINYREDTIYLPKPPCWGPLHWNYNSWYGGRYTRPSDLVKKLFSSLGSSEIRHLAIHKDLLYECAGLVPDLVKHLTSNISFLIVFPDTERGELLDWKEKVAVNGHVDRFKIVDLESSGDWWYGSRRETTYQEDLQRIIAGMETWVTPAVVAKFREARPAAAQAMMPFDASLDVV